MSTRTTFDHGQAVKREYVNTFAKRGAQMDDLSFDGTPWVEPDPPLDEALSAAPQSSIDMMKNLKRWTINGRPMYYDKDGTPLSLWDWSEKFRDRDYAVVARDRVCDFIVSTVWLGLDHGYGAMTALFPDTHVDPRPVIFETMVFDQLAPREVMGITIHEDRYQERYCTMEEAMIGHAAAVAFARQEGAARPAVSAFEMVIRDALLTSILRPPTNGGQD